MREIKFRAWSCNLKKMFQVYGWQFSTVYVKGDNNEKWSEPIESVKLMQYTGLKDKNGREIYEGDIVEYNDHSMNGNLINVTFDVELGCWHKARDYSYGKIIGNIYETPNLLTN